MKLVLGEVFVRINVQKGGESAGEPNPNGLGAEGDPGVPAMTGKLRKEGILGSCLWQKGQSCQREEWGESWRDNSKVNLAI